MEMSNANHTCMHCDKPTFATAPANFSISSLSDPFGLTCQQDVTNIHVH